MRRPRLASPRLGLWLALLPIATLLPDLVPLAATTVVALGASDLAARAGSIVHATCIDCAGERDARGRIVTRYTFRIHETLKGESEPILEFVQLGGEHGGLATVIPGLSRHSRGDEVILFLSDAYGDEGRYRLPVGLDQGVYRVIASPGGAGRRVVRCTADLVLVPPEDGAGDGGDRFPEHVAPDVFKAAVRRKVAELEKK